MTSATSNLARPARPPRAFTLAELIVGLLLLTIIGGATAAVAAAMSRGWQLGESSATSSITITRTLLRIQDKVQRAKALGQWRGGSLSPSPTDQGAAILFWRGDDSDAGDNDGQMQLEETQLLEHDPATNELVIWQIEYPSDPQRALSNGPFPIAILDEATAITQYKTRPHVQRHVITRGVRGAAFHLITPTGAEQRPQFEFRLKFTGPNGEAVEYGTSSPRSLWKPS